MKTDIMILAKKSGIELESNGFIIYSDFVELRNLQRFQSLIVKDIIDLILDYKITIGNSATGQISLNHIISELETRYLD